MGLAVMRVSSRWKFYLAPQPGQGSSWLSPWEGPATSSCPRRAYRVSQEKKGGPGQGLSSNAHRRECIRDQCGKQRSDSAPMCCAELEKPAQPDRCHSASADCGCAEMPPGGNSFRPVSGPRATNLIPEP